MDIFFKQNGLHFGYSCSIKKKVNKCKLKFKQNPGLLLPFRNPFVLKKNLYHKEYNNKEYKDYRNLLSTILKQSKTSYYKHYFEFNWNSIENIWKGIRSIITIKDISADIPKSISVDGATIFTPMAISHIFSNQVSSIAGKTKLNISFSHKYFFDFLKNKSNTSFFISPTDKTEIENIISSLGSNKSV